MKNKIFTLVFATLFANYSFAQTTAMDFTMNDCNRQMHNLFSELDQNNVIILEFFMLSCGSCIVAGDKLDAMHTQLEQEFPGKVKFYHFGYSNNYTCTDISNWVTSNGYNSTPFDSGGAQVAYYGGMGMPTVAVVAGTQHQVLFSNVGFSTNDTATIASATRSFFSSISGVKNVLPSSVEKYTVSPNPVSEIANVELTLNEATDLKIQIVNINGQVIREVLSEKVQKGFFFKNISVADLNAGIYFVKTEANRAASYRKLVVAK